jgi:hypothetical protein
MKIQVVLKQANKIGNVSFKATAVLNLGNENVESVSKEIAKFCKATIELHAKQLALGYKAGKCNSIKKSLPMQLVITGYGEDMDIQSIENEWRNFGKFAEETTEAKLRQFIFNEVKHKNTFAEWF